MTMEKQEQHPLQAQKGMFDVVMVATKQSEDLETLGLQWHYAEDPLREVKQIGTVVHRATLRAAVTSDHDPARFQEVVAAHRVS